MNEEIDETEFYHQDFTTASDWEIFIARLEEIINEWKVEQEKAVKEDDPFVLWNVKSESLSFVDFDFNLSLYRKNAPNINENIEESGGQRKNPFETFYDFELFDPQYSNEHYCIAKWYGLNEFIVLSPADNIGINSETRIKVLLSSLYIVSANQKCEIPLFVQIREKWQRCYLGVNETDVIRTNLEMVHLKSGPRLCQYLSGLLDMFKSKIVSPIMTSTILVSLQSTYILNDFGNFLWKQDYLNAGNDSFDTADLFVLPFGVTFDSIEALILKTTWHHLNHRSMRDSETYSDFDPMRADQWSSLVKMTDQPLCLLGECLSEFLHLLNNHSTVYDVLGDFASSDLVDIDNPLDLLTESKVPTISTLLSRATRNSSKTKRGAAPLSEDVLVPMLYFLFPDAEENSPFAYNISEKQNIEMDLKENFFDLHHECRGLKTCATDSLVWRLALVLAHALQSLGGVRAFSHLWFEFVQEMRYRWEKSIQIPGLLPGYPDLRTSLIHQKLQMLNCCIERKQCRENSSVHFDSAEGSSTDEEEFFDCADKPEEELKRKVKYSLWNQPTGRLGKFNSLKLIKSGDPLYIPVTQEPVPKSEDQLEEDTDVLLKLGANAEGSELRAKMMSASLLSDMESFKAANPGSILEDFIRWYSPRDWIEETDELDEWGQKKGDLSSRMKIEDNFWVQTWQSAKPVPAHRQKRLFDDTREAEKVLHFFDSRNLTQICEMIVPVISHAAIYKLNEEIQQVSVELPDTAKRMHALIKTIERISREIKLQSRKFEAFIQEVTALELKVSQVNSLMYKFNPAGAVDENLSNLIANLVTGREIEILDKDNSILGSRMVTMFSDSQKRANMILSEQAEEDGKSVKGTAVLPQANQKEIVMRVSVPRPATYSAQCPQFLRAILSKSEFRLVGAFSEDISFF